MLSGVRADARILLLDRRECAFFQYFRSSLRNPDELLCTCKANLWINLLQDEEIGVLSGKGW